MSQILPANRVAAITLVLTGMAAFIASIIGVFPQSWQNTALGITGLLKMLVTGLHFMSGAQKYDALALSIPVVVAGPKPDAVDANTDGQAAAA